MIWNLLKYTCTKNCRNRWSSDEAIASTKLYSFSSHVVYDVVEKNIDSSSKSNLLRRRRKKH